MDNNLPIDKLEKIASYSKNKAKLYPTFFTGVIIFLYLLASSIAILVRLKWDDIAIGLLISMGTLLPIWFIILGPLLQLFNLSFIVDRALNNDTNPWRSRKPYFWLLKFYVFWASYAFNMINLKRNWIFRYERKKIALWLNGQNDNNTPTVDKIFFEND
ncbi:MAG0130/MAG3770 family membrane protein [Mycoplasma tauri]|uniref:MAG0130/MAG3770 family membrane protein n=1 Tax=Mycoplasma tauri TaxID=547987 RepID=UPI001CBF8609|nr:hypothetical protein [Mycoplasma tauri]MBZ4204279.1 hypothetical protein [Mycoplasma tauri]